MNHFIEIVTSVDPRFTIGWGAIWFGLGCMITAAAWGRSRYREARRIIHVIQTEIGHVMRHCDDKKHGGMVHVQCLCGESSLMYNKDDPSAPGLMEQWEDEHITSQMESIGR